jgi:hypothetical protein
MLVRGELARDKFELPLIFINSCSVCSCSSLRWDKEYPPITAAALQKRREEFWDTRVQGRAEMWAALRVACEASAEEATMAAILESAQLQPLDIEREGEAFTYDQRGFKYEVPLDCIYTPGSLIKGSSSPRAQLVLQVQPAPAQGSSSARYSTEEAKSAEAAAVAQPAAVAASGKSLKFKVRFSNGLPDLTLDQRTGCTIGQLKSVIAEKYPALTPDRTRIYYLGKFMSSHSWNLGEIGMKKEMVLQCFIPGFKQS